MNILKPSGACKTFSDYANQVYLPYISNQLQSVKRVDIIWDRYIPNSLKVQTRDKRGSRVCRRVEADVRLNANWGEFLKADSNKTELFRYLAEQATMLPHEANKCILSTSNTVVLSSSLDVMPEISPCTHEEADTRLILHDCAPQVIVNIILRTVDTDFIVLAIATCNFRCLQISRLWIEFGVGKQYRYIAIHDIVRALGEEKSQLLHVFHAITGCDQTSGFLGQGKSTAWATWMSYGEATTAFMALSKMPTMQDVFNVMPVLERFVVLLYDWTSLCQGVNDARKVLFAQKVRTLENIHTTSNALLQHTARVSYQACHCWGQCIVSNPELP